MDLSESRRICGFSSYAAVQKTLPVANSDAEIFAETVHYSEKPLVFSSQMMYNNKVCKKIYKKEFFS